VNTGHVPFAGRDRFDRCRMSTTGLLPAPRRRCRASLLRGQAVPVVLLTGGVLRRASRCLD